MTAPRLAVLLLALAAPTATAATGGSGVITQRTVGKLKLLASSETAVVRFAGDPDRSRSSNEGADQFRTLGYGSCKSKDPWSCRTVFSLRILSDGGTVLTGFSTTGKAFRTRVGTRVGTTIRAMRRIEKGERIDNCRGGWTLGGIQIGSNGRRVSYLAVTRGSHVSANFGC